MRLQPTSWCVLLWLLSTLRDYDTQTYLHIFPTHFSCRFEGRGEGLTSSFAFLWYVAFLVNVGVLSPVLCCWCQGVPVPFNMVFRDVEWELWGLFWWDVWFLPLSDRSRSCCYLLEGFLCRPLLRTRAVDKLNITDVLVAFADIKKNAFSDVTDNFCVSWRDENLISLNISNGYESNILLYLIYGYVLPLPVDYLDW